MSKIEDFLKRHCSETVFYLLREGERDKIRFYITILDADDWLVLVAVREVLLIEAEVNEGVAVLVTGVDGTLAVAVLPLVDDVGFLRTLGGRGGAVAVVTEMADGVAMDAAPLVLAAEAIELVASWRTELVVDEMVGVWACVDVLIIEGVDRLLDMDVLLVVVVVVADAATAAAAVVVVAAVVK